MRWPTWIDELRERYLADEANVFVLHGAVAGTTFAIGEEQLDCVGVLQQFLAPTRPIVGVLRPWPHPSRLEFRGVMDRTRFENLVKAHDFVEGHVEPLQETDPSEALARIWRALDTTGTDQAYLIVDAHRIAPGHRRRVDPIPGAPGFLEWPRNPGLRASNNLVVLIVEQLDALRAELLDGSAVLEVRPEAAVPEPASIGEPPALGETPLPAFTDATPASVDRALPVALDDLPDAPDPTLVPPEEVEEVSEPAPDPDSLVPELRAALGRTLLAYDAPERTALLPIMDATAQVMASHRPDRFGALSFSLDEDGSPTATGAGAADFLALWRADITLDAAGSMIVRALDGNGKGDVDATGLRVLAKRVSKALGV